MSSFSGSRRPRPSSLTLQIRTFDVPPAARGQLSAILRFGPDGEAARQGAACIGQFAQ